MAETDDVPTGLGERGSLLWTELTADLEFDAHEQRYLFEACRALDVIGDLTAAVDKDGLMITGSTGQSVVHPAVAEIRQQQTTFLRLIGSVSLPEDEAKKDLQNHRRAKAGSEARWGTPAASPVRRLRG